MADIDKLIKEIEKEIKKHLGHSNLWAGNWSLSHCIERALKRYNRRILKSNQ